MSGGVGLKGPSLVRSASRPKPSNLPTSHPVVSSLMESPRKVGARGGAGELRALGLPRKMFFFFFKDPVRKLGE